MIENKLIQVYLSVNATGIYLLWLEINISPKTQCNKRKINALGLEKERNRFVVYCGSVDEWIMSGERWREFNSHFDIMCPIRYDT